MQLAGMTRIQLSRAHLVHLCVILVLAFAVRGLTAYFVYQHLSDPGWFQAGSYALFDRQAQAIMDSKSSIFWIDDPSQPETAVYPPGYPLWIAVIYKLSGERSATSVQSVQWVLDSLSVLLIVGIALTARNWCVSAVAGVMAALSPLLALSGATPLADAPTSWLVLTGLLFLLVAVKTQTLLRSLIAGVLAGGLVGASSWLRANALMLPFFWATAMLFIQASWTRRIRLSAAVVLGALLVMTPLFVRNAVAFHVFTPPGLGLGTNLWEGIGETDRAGEFAAVYGDQALIEQERVALGVPRGAPFSLYYPNGVQRDRERMRKALGVIWAHPIWYAGVMLRRMAGVLKFAGEPVPYCGSAGINVTSKKTLPPGMQGGVMGLLVNALGMVQSVMRYLSLPLMLIGIAFALRGHWRMTLVLLSTVLYYLVVGSALHSEIRYGLPMQALLFVFAGVAVSELISRVMYDAPVKINSCWQTDR